MTYKNVPASSNTEWKNSFQIGLDTVTSEITLWYKSIKSRKEAIIGLSAGASWLAGKDTDLIGAAECTD